MRLQVEPTEALQDYVAEVSLREPDVLRELRERTSELPLNLMQISPEQGQFMSLLVRALGVRKALEVGVFTGYSLVATALGLPAQGKVIGCEIDRDWAEIALEYARRAGVAERVEVVVGDARRALAGIAADPRQVGSFDFVFIDADKEGYEEYYEYALELLRPGGLLLVDNVLWHGAVIDDSAQDSETRAVRAFNAKVAADKRVEISLLPFADGLTFVLKR